MDGRNETLARFMYMDENKVRENYRLDFYFFIHSNTYFRSALSVPLPSKSITPFRAPKALFLKLVWV